MSELKWCPFCGKEVKIEAESKKEVWEAMNKLIEKEKLVAVTENLEERIMNKEKLNDILEKHNKWLEGEEDGERANLSYANLRGADLRGANLSDANLRGANLIYANLSYADLRGANLSDANLSYANLRGANLIYANLSYANLSDANLSYANLRGANLSYANLRGADLDFSCLPLWCGSLCANFDDRQLIQIAYHLVKAGVNSNNASAETKKELSKLIDFANKFHRVEECGRIKKEVEE